jgi:hypothetical protein
MFNSQYFWIYGGEEQRPKHKGNLSLDLYIWQRSSHAAHNLQLTVTFAFPNHTSFSLCPLDLRVCSPHTVQPRDQPSRLLITGATTLDNLQALRYLEMSSFASLLAQSKAQTQARNVEVQSTLAQRQERERREQEEREQKHREELARQAKQRQAQAEAEKREAGRVKQRELEQQAKEQERERKKKAEMDKLLGKKRHEERERESNAAGGSGSRVGGSGSPRKRRSRSNSPSGGGGGPVLTRLERRALKTDPNARPAWAISLVGERGGRSGSPSSHPKQSSVIRTKKTPQSSGMINGNGYGDAIKLSRKETGSVADYLEEKRQRELAVGKSKSFLNASGGISSRAASTGPLPGKPKANGLKPKSAPSSVAGHKRRRSYEEDEDSMFGSDNEDDDDDLPPTKRRAMEGGVLARFGLNLNRREYHDYDDDDLSDMEAGYDEVEKENERAYVTFSLLARARVLWDTDESFWPQLTRSKAGRPNRSGRRNAARTGKTKAEDGKDDYCWFYLSMFGRLATCCLDMFVDTSSCLMLISITLVPQLFALNYVHSFFMRHF